MITNIAMEELRIPLHEAGPPEEDQRSSSSGAMSESLSEAIEATSRDPSFFSFCKRVAFCAAVALGGAIVLATYKNSDSTVSEAGLGMMVGGAVAGARECLLYRRN